jgi:hypothetical protein
MRRMIWSCVTCAAMCRSGARRARRRVLRWLAACLRVDSRCAASARREKHGHEARISRFAELISTALVAGYRDEQKRQLLAEVSQRLSLVDSLLEGRAFDEWSLREVAGSLRLPINGPFVVVAAQAPTVGDEPLREIESKLRSLDIFSVWQLLPDVQVGIVHVKSDPKLDVVVALMSRTTTARVGVSAVFGDLRDTPRALHVARMMLRGPTDSTSSVAMFDGSILATAAVSALGGDDPNGRRCVGRFRRPSPCRAGDAVRNVSGVAGH